MVEQMGVDFGALEGRVRAHPDDNPNGYLEQGAIMRLNDKILRAYGGAWWHPPTMPSGWERSRRLRLARWRARRTLQTRYTRDPWGFKDPRVSLTFPFWREIAGEMDCVICVRDPAEVVASLLTRFRESLPGHPARILDGRAWSAVWLTYTNAALASTRNLHRLIVCYSDLLGGAEDQVTRLSGFLGLQAPETTRRQITAIIEPQLWRNRADRIEEEKVAATVEARRLYDLLTASAGAA
jgi:hypothetical protein